MAHLAEAMRWQGARVDLRALMVAAIGTAGPILIGLLLGRVHEGLAIGLGAMLLAGGPRDEAAAERPSHASAIMPAMLAIGCAALIAGLPGRDLATIALAALAALVSGYGRPIAVAAIRFLVYFVLCLTLLEASGEHRGAAAILFGAGALWNLAVRAMLPRPPLPAAAAAPEAPARAPTPAQRRAYFRRTLATAAGWQFPVRLGAGLAAAMLIRDLWPAHHFSWVVLTVALLTQRPIEHLPVKLTQRTLGTTAGVAASWAILALHPSQPVLAGILCLLAIAAPFARGGNYLAWSAVSSPAILIVMDFGRPIETMLLTDRLVATLAGAAIVLAGNFFADRWMPRPPAPQ